MDGGDERTGSSSETTGRESEGTRGRERRHLDCWCVCRVESLLCIRRRSYSQIASCLCSY